MTDPKNNPNFQTTFRDGSMMPTGSPLQKEGSFLQNEEKKIVKTEAQLEAAHKELETLIYSSQYDKLPERLNKIDSDNGGDGVFLKSVLNYPKKNTHLYSLCRGSNAQPVCTSEAFLPTVQLLIDRGANINASMPETRSTALHIAAYRGRLDVILLLMRHGACASTLNTECDTPLEDARANERFDDSSVLLRALAIKILQNVVHDTINTPYEEDYVFVDIQRGTAISERLLSQWHVRLGTQWTALHHACLCGNVTAFDQLIQRHRNRINESDADGWTPLHVLVARYITYGRDSPKKQAQALAMIGKLSGVCNWMARVATKETLLRHPLMVQAFACHSADSPSVLYFKHQRLQWPHDPKTERLGVLRWTDDTPPHGKDVQAFFTLTQQRRLRIVNVERVDGASVSGTQLYRDLVVTPNGLQPHETLSGGQGSSSEYFLEVPSLMPQFTISQENPSYYGEWSLGDSTVFRFIAIHSIDTESEKYGIAYGENVKGANALLVLKRDTKELSLEKVDDTAGSKHVNLPYGMYQYSDLRRISSQSEGGRESADLHFGPSVLHWIEGHQALQDLVPEYKMPSNQLIARTQTMCPIRNPMPTSNVHSLHYLTYEAKPNGWGSKMFTVFCVPDDPHTALYLLHCMCSVGDIALMPGLVEHVKQKQWNYGDESNFVNACREFKRKGISHKEYALVVAAAFGHHNVVRDLIVLYGANVHIADGLALRKAIKGGFVQVAEYLLQEMRKHQWRPLTQYPSEDDIPTSEEVAFVQKHDLLSNVGKENVLRENIHNWSCQGKNTSSNTGGGRKALLLIGMQNDDFKNHSSAGEEYKKELSKFLTNTGKDFDQVIVFLNEYDPKDAQDCIRRTSGAEIQPDILGVLNAELSSAFKVVTKYWKHHECYSAFFDASYEVATPLRRTLQQLNVVSLVVCGLGLDGFLSRSVEDALRMGFSVEVILPLCVTTKTQRLQGKAPEVSTLRDRGAKVITNKEFKKRGRMLITEKVVKPPPIVERILAQLLNSESVRLHLIFEGNVNCQRLLRVLDGYDFGMEPRNGEIFLYLALLLNHLYEQAFQKAMDDNAAIDIHSLGMHSFTIEGIFFNSGDYHALRYPLHYLMMRLRYSPLEGQPEYPGLLSLLQKCIAFINKSAAAGACDVLGELTTQLPGGIKPKDLGKHFPAGPCPIGRNVPGCDVIPDLDDLTKTRCKCIFHVPLRPVRKAAATSESSLWAGIRSLNFSECPKCWCTGAPHESPEPNNLGSPDSQVNHLLCCTPLMLSVRLNLSHVVKAMMQGGVLTVGQEVGRDLNGSSFTYDVLEDIWEALPVRRNAAGEFLVQSCPPLHYALRQYQYVKEQIQRQCPINFIPLIQPGLGDTLLEDSVDENVWRWTYSSSLNNSSMGSVDLDTARWKLPTACQWVCQHCGVSMIKNDDLSEEVVNRYIKPSLQWHLEVCRELMKASLVTKRAVTLRHSNVPSITLRIGNRHVKIGDIFDRCGVFAVHKGACGLTLTLQYAPQLMNMLIKMDSFRKARFNDSEELCKLVDQCSESLCVRLKRRHLWGVTQGGTEIVVEDQGLNLVHFIAMYDDMSLMDHFIAVFKREKLVNAFEGATKYLGYTPWHYACYASSCKVLEAYINVCNEVRDIQTTRRILNAPAIPRVVGAKTLTIPEVTLLGENAIKTFSKTGSFTASFSSLENIIADKKYNTIGETPAHVAASFGHAQCLEILLQNNCDMTKRTFAEDLDPHDIALSLQYRHKRQLLMYRLDKKSQRTIEETERSKKESKVLNDCVMSIQEATDIGKKLQRFGRKHFCLETFWYLLFLGCLITFGFLMMNEHVTQGSNTFISYVHNKVGTEPFVLDFSTPKPTVTDSPLLGTQFKATFEDIGSIEDVGWWMSHVFRKVLFKGTVPGTDTNSSRHIWEEGKYLFVGAARVAVLRSATSLCAVKAPYSALLPACYPNLQRGNIDTSKFVLKSSGRILPYASWNNRLIGQGQGFVSSVTNLWYPWSEGNYLDIRPGNDSVLSRDFEDVIAMLNQDASVRLMSVWFVVFNVNLDMYVTCELDFEIPAAGGVRASQRYYAVRDHYYTTSLDWFRLALEIILLIFFVKYAQEEVIDASYTAYHTLIKYNESRKKWRRIEKEQDEQDVCAVDALGISDILTVEEIKDEKSFCGKFSSGVEAESRGRNPVQALLFYAWEGIMNHWIEDWNAIDIVVIALLLAILVLYTQSLSYSQSLATLNWMSGQDARFPDNFHAMAFNQVQILNVVGACVMFASIKLLKYVRLMPSLGPIALAIGASATHRSITTFVMVFGIVVIGLVVACYIAFSPYVAAMHSFKATFFFVFRMVTGDTDFDSLQSGHEYLGPFVWIVCVAFVTILLLNILIAIVGNVYDTEIIESEAMWNVMVAEEYTESEKLKLPPLSRPHGNFFVQPFVTMIRHLFPKIGHMLGKAASKSETWECYVSSKVIDLAAQAEKRKALTNEDLLDEILVLKRNFKMDTTDGTNDHIGESGSEVDPPGSSPWV